MRILLPIVLLSTLAVPNPAFSAPCGAWTAAIEDDEGGPALTASVCIGEGAKEASLRITCGRQTMAMDYAPDSATKLPPDDNDNFKSQFRFASGPKTAELTGRYQGLNGAIGFQWKRGTGLTALLTSTGTISIEDKGKKVGGANFPLTNAKASIEKLERACK